MSFQLPFERQDLLLLRIPTIVLIVSGIVSSIVYFGADTLNQRASFDLSQSQARYEQAVTSVREIADEEETIIRYIDRYREIEAEGAVNEEDRLALIERIGELRSSYNLYPIQVDIGEQKALPLSYDPLDLNPGDPVNVNFSEISLLYSLLHEADLTRLLNALIDGSGLIVPESCDLTADNVNDLSFTTISFNLSANCQLLWVSFDLKPPEVTYEY